MERDSPEFPRVPDEQARSPIREDSDWKSERIVREYMVRRSVLFRYGHIFAVAGKHSVRAE